MSQDKGTAGANASGPILVASAVDAEWHPLESLLQQAVFGRSCHFLSTGVGKVAAAVGMLEAIDRLRPSLVLHLGCAGAFRESGLRLGDVVVATEEIFADEGADTDDGFLTLADLGFSPYFTEPEHGGHGIQIGDGMGVAIAAVPAEVLAAVRAAMSDFSVTSGRLLTVSSGSATNARARALWERWHALAESMEGAAVAWVAQRRGLRFLEVRGISNFVGRRERDAWQVEEACEHAALVAEWLLRETDVTTTER